MYCSETDVADTGTSDVAESGATSTQAVRIPDAVNEVLGDVPDEDEVFNINISASDKEPTYFFEEDDEAEEALRNVLLHGESSQPANTKPSKKTKAA